MSNELDDFVRASAKLLETTQSGNTADVQAAIMDAVDCLVAAVERIERRLDALERNSDERPAWPRTAPINKIGA